MELNQEKIAEHLHPLRRSNWVQIFPFLALIDFGRIGGGKSNVLKFDENNKFTMRGSEPRSSRKSARLGGFESTRGDQVDDVIE